MSKTHTRFEDEEYEPTESEDEYDSREKDLLERVRNKQDSESDSEVEVYGVHSETSSDIALSDVEGQAEDDDLPDVRAWGKEKRRFYSTDYVDPDYGGFQGKDAALADLEEEEARNLQRQLIEQLDDDDFALDLFNRENVQVEDEKQTEEVVKTDVSTLSKRQKIDLLTKESPEFFGLIEDFKCKMLIVRDFLCPIICLSKEDKVPKGEALEFVKTHYRIILNYCTNINMYLLLKMSRVNVQNHPVIKRLYQYRQLLAQTDPIFESIIKPQIEILIEKTKNAVTDKQITNAKLLKVLKKALKKRKNSESESNILEPSKKKLKELALSDEKNKDNVEENESLDVEQLTTDAGARRGITYQIAKNKGLTPRRNKMQRNPRVKHRNKYRVAKIRRKGAVREVRTEMSRYGGEISGIKASVTKSIKIKS